ERLRGPQHLLQAARRLFDLLRSDRLDLVDRALRAATADRDVERAVGRDADVGRREALTPGRLEEDLRLRRVACALRREREEVDLAERPVEGEEAAPVMLRELRVTVDGHAG